MEANNPNAIEISGVNEGIVVGGGEPRTNRQQSLTQALEALKTVQKQLNEPWVSHHANALHAALV
jgi:hypothetical protein